MTWRRLLMTPAHCHFRDISDPVRVRARIFAEARSSSISSAIENAPNREKNAATLAGEHTMIYWVSDERSRIYMYRNVQAMQAVSA